MRTVGRGPSLPCYTSCRCYQDEDSSVHVCSKIRIVNSTKTKTPLKGTVVISSDSYLERSMSVSQQYPSNLNLINNVECIGVILSGSFYFDNFLRRFCTFYKKNSIGNNRFLNRRIRILDNGYLIHS